MMHHKLIGDRCDRSPQLPSAHGLCFHCSVKISSSVVVMTLSRTVVTPYFTIYSWKTIHSHAAFLISRHFVCVQSQRPHSELPPLQNVHYQIALTKNVTLVEFNGTIFIIPSCLAGSCSLHSK